MCTGSRHSSYKGDNNNGTASNKLDMKKAVKEIQKQLDALTNKRDKTLKLKGQQKENKLPSHMHRTSKKLHEDHPCENPTMHLPKLKLHSFHAEEDLGICLDWIANLDNLFALYSIVEVFHVKLAC